MHEALTHNPSADVTKLLERWGDGYDAPDTEQVVLEEETKENYQRITHVLSTNYNEGNVGLDEILLIRVKKLCNDFLSPRNKGRSRSDLAAMNCELTNLLYCMLLENDYLQSQVKRLHFKWISEAQCNWKKL